jgi:hypothetical protein
MKIATPLGHPGLFAILSALILAGALPAGADEIAGLDPALGAYRDSPRAAEIQDRLARAVASGVDPSSLRELLARSVERGLTEDDFLRMVTRIRGLADRDLPVSPVLGRYLKGLSLGLPPDRVEAAVVELEGRLVAAAREVDELYPDPAGDAERNARRVAIDHAAWALGVGVPIEHLESSLALAGGEPSPLEASQAPLLSLALMVDAGVESSHSLEMITFAWDRGYRGDDLARLGRSVSDPVRSGTEPAVMVERVMSLLESEESPGRVFEDLEGMRERPDEVGRPEDRLPREKPPAQVPESDRPDEPGGERPEQEAPGQG